MVGSEFEVLKRKTLESNVRSNSLEHALRLIYSEEKKTFVELGTIRASENNNHHEGYSTLLLSFLAKIMGSKFYSVDISYNSIQESMSILDSYNSELTNFVEFVNMDQYDFLEQLEDGIDFLYIDAIDKDLVISRCLNKLNNNAIIMIDDMSTESPDSLNQRESCIKFVNDNDFLYPINRVDYFQMNLQESYYQNLLDSESKLSENFKKYELGVQQYPFQIILRYKKSHKT